MQISEIIQALPEAQQYPLYRKLKGAIRDGKLSAVPVTASLQVYRANKPLTVLDHFLLNSPEEVSQWLAEASRPTSKLTGAARYAVQDPSKLTPEELRRRAEEYRASLSKQPKTKRKAK